MKCSESLHPQTVQKSVNTGKKKSVLCLLPDIVLLINSDKCVKMVSKRDWTLVSSDLLFKE